MDFFEESISNGAMEQQLPGTFYGYVHGETKETKSELVRRRQTRSFYENDAQSGKGLRASRLNQEYTDSFHLGIDNRELYYLVSDGCKRSIAALTVAVKYVIELIKGLGTPNEETTTHKACPDWQLETYIHGGYRPVYNSYRKCIASLVKIHNQTGNIYTHLVGFVIFTLITIFLNPVVFPYINPGLSTLPFRDLLLVYVYLFTVITCHLMSSAFHTCENHSEEGHRLFLSCDFAGIIILITGSFLPQAFYGFYTMPVAQAIFVTFIVAISVIAVVMILSQQLHSPRMRYVRPVLFFSICVFDILPTVLCYYINGYEEASRILPIKYLIGTVTTYTSGTLIYAFHLPERWTKGKTDIWGTSHQIFHISVTVAALIRFVGTLEETSYRHLVNA